MFPSKQLLKKLSSFPLTTQKFLYLLGFRYIFNTAVKNTTRNFYSKILAEHSTKNDDRKIRLENVLWTWKSPYKTNPSTPKNNTLFTAPIVSLRGQTQIKIAVTTLKTFREAIVKKAVSTNQPLKSRIINSSYSNSILAVQLELLEKL